MWEGESRSGSQISHDYDYERDLSEQPRSADQAGQLHLTDSFESSGSSSPENGLSESSENAYAWWEVANRSYSSATSLGPSQSPLNGRRKLLLIYIHGFMGAEISFQRFPVHVHNLVTKSLSETHVVFSKVYPRYKSRRAMKIACDDFSEWLSPHESHDTDVILLGHSLGGILSAEVALAESDPTNSTDIFKHDILGLINFDVPFLGLHPGIIGTGIASLFQPKRSNESSQDEASGQPGLASDGTENFGPERMASWFQQSPDSNYDPTFPNDTHRAKRSQLDGMLHFLKKNTGQLTSAMKEYATSYFEFGGCLTDYSGLRRRYARLKELEAVDNMSLKRDRHGRLLRRIRFVNYYTSSPGFPKKLSIDAPGSINEKSLGEDKGTPKQDTESSIDVKGPSSPLRTKEDDEDDDKLHNLDPKPIDEHESMENFTISDNERDSSLMPPTTDSKFASLMDFLPPLPTIPDPPQPIDPSRFEDKDIVKHAQKEYTRLLKLHEQAKKEREKTIKGRGKLLEQLKRKHEKHTPSPSPAETYGSLDEECVVETVTASENAYFGNPEDLPDSQPTCTNPKQAFSEKRTRDRKFCILPKNGDAPDPLWVRLFIPDVDEVVAHQSIFLPNGLYYEWLVGDTVARIEQWVQDDCTRRTILDTLESDGAGVDSPKGPY